ncbi:sporulation transcription factor Spo0A [Clostridium sp. MD294]|uniref:sporulation transcription factor Spo0A n=1 Tax=Clostridium sp. MD294 TaxID=97138 RepID=UPI0002CA4174|nr:sporulation transcription factor Spo0A [Clostridium sp. MD294]NDO46803.1 sporulation transcription factor Spo0A [Clostridium sp. MD294]USF28755.1 Stage 0 sporulation protein A [Clostridium sp. MD294]
MLNTLKKTILLADRDVNYMRSIKQYLEEDEKVEVVDMVDNGEKALERAEEKRPDMILMDVLLGEKDGLWVLEELSKKRINSNCIILSVIGTDDVVRQAIDLGAMYYMVKPVESNILLKRVTQILNTQKRAQNTNLLQQEYLQKKINLNFEEQKRNELETVISKLLNKMGITASIKGYHFIRKGVMMVIENEDAILSMTKGLYPDIAKEYNTTAGKVERAMRHAIETAWKRTGKEIYSELAGYSPIEKPTNSQFIAIMSEYLRV